MIRQKKSLPGQTAINILKCTCSAETMERVFDPFVADLQAEWLADQSSGQSAHAKWRLCNAYWALVIQIIVCGFGSLGSRALVPVSASSAAAPFDTIESTRSKWFRYCGPLAFASVVTFGLFVLMSLLIAQQPGGLIPGDPLIMGITRARLIPDSTPVPPRETLPERPIQNEEPVNTPIPIPNTAGSVGDFKLPLVHSKGIPIPGIDVRMNPVAVDNRQPSPTIRVNPVYPTRPLQRGVEGWVEVEFTIDAAGSVSDPRVINAKPRATFDRAALRAIERWKYEPMLVDGTPTARPGVRTRLLFEIE